MAEQASGGLVRAPEAAAGSTRQSTRRLLADAALLAVAAIWGSTFVMVKDAVAAYPVFSFLALRFAFATAALVPLLCMDRRRRRRLSDGLLPPGGMGHPHLFPSAALIGLALFAGYAFQTAGLRLTTPAKAGFITGLYVVLVPLGAARLLRQPPGRNAWIGVGLALTGLALLSLTDDLRIAAGDLLVLGCAVAFAAHILLTGHFAPRHDPLRLTLGQAATVMVLSTAAALIFERPAGLAGLPGGLTQQVIIAAAFTGILATSVAFGLQTAAQRFTTSTHTALIFAAEPVFAGLFSFLLIGEVLGVRQLLGCGLIGAGMVVAELRRKG